MDPRVRPEGPNAGTQSWRQLLFQHWIVPTDAMRALVPPSLELDLFDGNAYVGVVPFSMQHVRPAFVPHIFALDFLETNVRTYVTKDGAPGVYFFSLEAASRLAVAAARLTFSLPYWFAGMKLDDNGDQNFTYETVREKNGALHRVQYRVGDTMEKGPLETFLVERYFLYVEREGRMQRAQVHHRPYPLRQARVIEVNDTLIASAGLPPASGLPVHACFSDGVDVEVFSPREC